MFYSFCRQKGYKPDSGVEFLSDGAGWLRSIAADVFPLGVKRLDLYHLSKACSDVLDGDEWSVLRTVLLEGDRQTFTDTLEVILLDKGLDDEKRKKVLNYVRNNQDSLDYGPEKRNGSGAIEKNIGIHVGRRLKRQGMSWSPDGAYNLVALRTKKLNMLWHNKLG